MTNRGIFYCATVEGAPCPRCGSTAKRRKKAGTRPSATHNCIECERRLARRRDAAKAAFSKMETCDVDLAKTG